MEKVFNLLRVKCKRSKRDVLLVKQHRISTRKLVAEVRAT
jgi:hypothetical protein